MSLRALRTLVAIARHRTFARAGESIGLTQSAVSLQVKSLEAEFNVRLFDRSRREPSLTEAGRIVLAHAEQILALYDGIPDALSDEKALVGRLRIGAIQTALSGPLPNALLSLRRDHPGLRVHVAAGLSAELAQRVADGELDAAITSHPVRPHPADLVWSTLYEDRFWLLAPPQYAEHDARTLLTELPFIRFDAQAWAGRMIAAELRRLGVRVREEMVLDSKETSGAAHATLDFIGDENRSITLTKRGRARQEIVRRNVDALALDRLDDKGRDLTRHQHLFERGKIVERNDSAVR